MITKAAYIGKRLAALNALDIEIARLTDFADKATGDVVLAYYEAIDALQAKRDKAANRLRDLQAVGEQSWVRNEATTGMENAWNEVRHAVLAVLAMS